jgi:hypothetical protein
MTPAEIDALPGPECPQQKHESMDDWIRRCNVENQMKIAALFLGAIDADSLQGWLEATRQWNDRGRVGPLGFAVEALREAFYHDGSLRSRELVRQRADDLRDSMRQVFNANVRFIRSADALIDTIEDPTLRTLARDAALAAKGKG